MDDMNKESKFTLENAVKELFGEKFPVEKAISLIEERIEKHRYLSAGIIKQLNSIILAYQNQTYEKEKRASVYIEPESKYQIKTPESIIEKMWRSKRGHIKGADEKLKYTLDNFLEAMEDIIRFRILCNYLCDVDRITGILPGQMTRLNYEIIGEPKDFINKAPEERKKGHRAVHFIFKATFNMQVYLFEVQIMTLLQNAWDRKDHSIVYEHKRIGKEIPLKTRMRSYAMSEMLYVADDYFNELLLKNNEGG